jgi:glycosyltransferase involved in cell wall biosynthesis
MSISALPPFFVPPGYTPIEYDKLPIKIIVPFYNASKFIERCVSSVITQKYDNFKTIFIDDASTDDSWDKLPHNDQKAICVKNQVNVTALPNIHKVIMEYCQPHDIVVLLDGDDWLPNNKVLQYINEFYCKNDCWIMYGQASWTDGRRGIAQPYKSKEEFSLMRKLPFYVSHIRTFRAGVYHAIEKQDPNFSCMKDKNEEFYRCTYDVAIMYPIMEISGYEKTKYNDKSLYIYNRDNPISDDKVRQQLQWEIHQEVLKKPAFKQIENY